MWTGADSKSGVVPQLLPQSPPTDERISSYISKFQMWMPRSYFGPTDAALPGGTASEFEVWQKKMRSGPLYHEKSETYLGGKWGVVWVIRALIVFLANAGASCGKIVAPVPIPEGYDSDRMGLGDWKRTIGWIKEWLELLRSACKKLKATYDQRALPVVVSESGGSDNDKAKDQDSAFDPDYDHPMGFPRQPVRAVSMLTSRSQPSRKSKVGVTYSFAAMDESDDEPPAEDENLEGQDVDSDSDSEANQHSQSGKSYVIICIRERLIEVLQVGGNKALKKPAVDLLQVPERDPVPLFHLRRHIFGPEPEPMPVRPFEGTAKQLTDEANAFVAKMKKSLESYQDTRYEAGHPYSSRMLRQVDERLAAVDESRRPLLACVFAQRGAWLKAETLWPQANKDYSTFWDLFRQGSRILVAIPVVKQSQPGPAATRLVGRTREIKAYTWAARCLFEQFQMAAQMSLLWANHLKDAWETISIESSLDDLEALVAGLRDWRRDYSAVMTDRKNYRRAVFAKHQVELYVKDFKDCWYTHGNPTKPGLSSEVKGERSFTILCNHRSHSERVYLGLVRRKCLLDWIYSCTI